MALLDFLKRKKEVEKSKEGKETEKKSVRKTEELLDAKKPGPDKSAPRISTGKPVRLGFSYDAVKEPHISEKAANLSEKSHYVFKVDANSNKPEIKKSIEGIYGVDVLSVNMIKIPPKKRRIGRTQGFRKGFTKAVVKIGEGQKIEIL